MGRDPSNTTPDPQWTPDQIEEMFHAALRAGDIEGVDAAIRVMCAVDPQRASDLYEALKIAVALRGLVSP